MSTIAEYKGHFLAGTQPKGQLTGLAARVIRGKQPADFETFTDDPSRKLVFFVGPDGLQKLIGKNGYRTMIALGYERDYLKGKILDGTKFKLVIVPEGKVAKLATWDNVIDLVEEVYPGSATLIEQHREALKNTPFDEIQRAAGYNFKDVDKSGKVDSRYMTWERYQKSGGTLVDARAFLYFAVYMKELFRGDGYTDDCGKSGPMEFIAPNIRIDACGEHEVIDLDVQLPYSGPSTMGRIDKLGYTDPNLIRTFYAPNLELAHAEGLKWRRRLTSAAKRERRNGGRLLVGIDLQWDFSDAGRLAVPGTFDDLERLIDRIIRGVFEEEYYSDFIITHDNHPEHVIHGETWWEDENGNPPDVSVPVHMELVDPKGRMPFLCHYLTGAASKPFRPRLKREYTINEYAPHLKQTGQGDIWVFAPHCKFGSDGVMLIPAFQELLAVVAVALDLNITHMYKGHVPDTDWFGPFRPCMDRPGHSQAGLNTELLKRVAINLITEVAGEAADFCVRAGELQFGHFYGPGNAYGQDPAVLNRVKFITNCTSPIIPDNPVTGKTPNADHRKAMAALGVQAIEHNWAFQL